MRKAEPLREPHLSRFELVDEIVRRGNGHVAARQATHSIALFEEIVTEYLARGGSIRLTGFGTLTVADRKARMNPDPRDKANRIGIPAVRVPKFRPGDTLKRAVRDGKPPPRKVFEELESIEQRRSRIREEDLGDDLTREVDRFLRDESRSYPPMGRRLSRGD